MSLTDEFRDAFETTDYTLINLDGLLIALHDIARENDDICNNTEASLALMAILNSAQDKTRAAMAQHSAEWEAVKNGQSADLEVAS